MSEWMSSNFFEIATAPTVFSNSHKTWIDVPSAKNSGTDFQNFAS